MTTYEYQGYDREGRSAHGIIEAPHLKAARERLTARGLLAENLRPATLRTGRQRRFGTELRASCYRELAALLRAGFPLAQALEMMLDAPEWSAVRLLLAGVRDRVREGDSLATALARGSARVRRFEQAALASAERAGRTHEVLDRLADYLERQAQIVERAWSAGLYPCIVLGLSLLVAFFSLGVMVPRFAALFEEARLALPAVTRILLRTGRAAGVVLPLALAVLGALGLAGGYRWRRDPEWRVRIDRVLFRVPPLGRSYTALVNVRFAQTMALLLGGGVTMVEAVQVAGQATGSPWLEALAEREAEAIRHGDTLAGALRRIPPLAGALAAWAQAGEAGGDVAGLFDMAAERCLRLWERRLTRGMALFEPALILAVGFFVLLLAVALLAPVLALNRSLL